MRQVFGLSLKIPILVKHILVLIVELFVFLLDFLMLSLVPLSRVFQLSIEFGLHLCLLQKHFLSYLIDLLLVFDLHGVTDSSDFLPSLSKVALELFALSLALLESLIELESGVIELAPVLIALFDFCGEVLFE